MVGTPFYGRSLRKLNDSILLGRLWNLCNVRSVYGGERYSFDSWFYYSTKKGSSVPIHLRVNSVLENVKRNNILIFPPVLL